MKRTIALAVALMITGASTAQIPSASYFNTGINTALNAVEPLGTNDNSWYVAEGTINSTYYKAQRCSTISGWLTPPSSFTAGWVSYPAHGCTGGGGIAQHGCMTNGPLPGDVDEFYRITFTLPPDICGTPISQPNAYKLTLRLFADNLVYKVYLNSTFNPAWTNSGANSTYNANNNHGSISDGKVVVLNQNFVAGTNTIYVHVRSGAPNNNGWTGFIAVGDQDYSTNPDSPCDPVVDYEDEDNEDPPSGDCCLGNSCGAHKNMLSSNYEIPMGGYDFFFSGDGGDDAGGGLDQVGVGYDCRDIMPAKFNTRTDERTSSPDGGGYPESIAIHGVSTYNGVDETSVGVYGEARNLELNSKSVGVWGTANGNEHNTGGYFYGALGQQYNIGVVGEAQPSTGSTAPHTYSLQYPTASIGVYGSGELYNSDPGGNSGPDWAGWFDGDVSVVGYAWINGTFYGSDRRFKSNITLVENPLERIQKLNGYTYNFKSAEFKGRGFDNAKHYGVIAQEVAEVFPELVRKDGQGYYAVDYVGLIPVLLESIKAQQAQINELKAMMNQSMGVNQDRGTENGEVLQLSDKNTLVLNQNVPNPFAESTIISYSIPEGFQKAQLIFRTSDGAVIKTADITRSGKGSFTVFADDLSNGSYSYSLVVDGAVADSKTMIKQ